MILMVTVFLLFNYRAQRLKKSMKFVHYAPFCGIAEAMDSRAQFSPVGKERMVLEKL